MGEPIRYRSTRGDGARRSFDDLLLSGTAPDGGLYVPESWPSLSLSEQRALSERSFAGAVSDVVSLFAAGSVLEESIPSLVASAYADFSHPEVAPLVRLESDLWLMELFHGPTLAFKDLALQVLGRLIPALLERLDRSVTILAATSGDTGSAAVAAFADCPRVRLVVLHPAGRVSEVQRRQMTAWPAGNVVNLAIEGDFDACQSLVKRAFSDAALVRRHGLVSVNSINWARIVVQAGYYAAAASSLRVWERRVSFVVPSGNFGNAYAAWAARRLGLDLGRVGVATNRNDVLARFFNGGSLSRRAVVPTMAPSMDIQVPSNFERLLFALLDEDGAAVASHVRAFSERGVLEVSESVAAAARSGFWSRAVSEAEIAREIAARAESGILLDPHSAIGVRAAAFSPERAAGGSGVTVSLACAHAAKFPEAVEAASGRAPPVPGSLSVLLSSEERYETLPAAYESLRGVLESR